MNVSVVIPFRGGCPHREAALDWVHANLQAEHPDWEIIIGVCPDGPWRKALALADGISQASGDRLVMHDADVWLHELADAVASPRPVQVPHYGVWRLTESETERFKTGGGPPYDLVRDAHVGRPCGGLFIFDRDVWNECPMDPRFEGWGQEDDSWGLAIETIYGVDLEQTRLPYQLIHLYHPREQTLSPFAGNEAGLELWKRYRDTIEPAAMRELLAEMKEVTCQ